MAKIVALTGAGISAESGFATFRDSGGMWEKYDVNDVATPGGWLRNPDLVTNFYNGLRTQLLAASPNDAHRLLADLEKDFEVTVVTQNVDDLHDRAGSSHIIYLHGELMKACSSVSPNDESQVVKLPLARPNGSAENSGYSLTSNDLAADGSRLRPYIVFFEEAVPKIEDAVREVADADIFLIIGTSMVVYPAASLIHYVPRTARVFLIDPKEVQIPFTGHHIEVIQEKATVGMRKVCEILRS